MRLLTTFAFALSVVVGLGARADDKEKDKGKDANQASTAKETIRGTISDVTIEGELVIDYNTKRAVEADMMFVTVVGTRVDNAADKPGHKDRHHHVYVVWVSPHTKITGTSTAGADTDKKRQDQTQNIDAIEVGEKVEVEIAPRALSHAENRPNRHKHGRHRFHFGDATSIKILATPEQQAETTDSNKRDAK
jgi:hypothetical protein